MSESADSAIESSVHRDWPGFRSREPDLVYVSNERAGEIITSLHVEGSPDLVVEIGSPGTRKRDETIKRKLYERAGVLEYWFVDPDRDLARVYRFASGEFDGAIGLSAEADDVLTTVLIPGLRISLRRLFRPLEIAADRPRSQGN